MKWLVLFFLGAIVATLGDRVHMAFGVLSYPSGGQPIWVFPEMGLAAVILAWQWRVFPGARKDGILPMREAIGPVIWFVVTYGASSPLSRWPVILTLGFLALFLWRAWHEKLSRPAWMYCILVAVGGALVESMISAAGLFSYRKPDWGLVPTWLPMLYLHVALATRAIGRALDPGDATTGSTTA
jgi:hypothetical protein